MDRFFFAFFAFFAYFFCPAVLLFFIYFDTVAECLILQILSHTKKMHSAVMKLLAEYVQYVVVCMTVLLEYLNALTKRVPKSLHSLVSI